MDNHAGNLLIDRCNSNYLSGLIDSDFGVYIHKFFPRGKLQLRPTIQFVNTDFCIIEVLSEVLKKYGINHHIRLRKATVGHDKKELVITRLIKCIEFADLFSGGCVVRKKQLHLLREFCKDRLYVVKTRGWKQNNTPYTKEQLNFFNNISYLNKHYDVDYGFRNGTLSWLAGMVDGDGSLCFVVTNRDRIIPTLDITTGSLTCLNNTIAIFNRYGIGYDVRESKSKSTKRCKTSHVYNIYVRMFDHLEKVCSLLKNRLIIKDQQCGLLLQYLRLKKECRFNSYSLSDIVCETRLLNKTPQRLIRKTRGNT